MAADNVKELSDEQLVHQTLGAERQLVSLRFQHSMSNLENTAELGNVRKSIARFKTELRTREADQGLSKDSLLAKHRKSFAKPEGEAATSEEEGGFLSGIVDRLTGNE